MSIGTMIVPTAEGATDGLKAIEAACKANKWTLIAPDGRVWMNDNPLILFAALAAVMRGEELRFGEQRNRTRRHDRRRH
jgi:hypothetical protein